MDTYLARKPFWWIMKIRFLVNHNPKKEYRNEKDTSNSTSKYR